jgi:hypothetical protein
MIMIEIILNLNLFCHLFLKNLNEDHQTNHHSQNQN